MICLLLFLGGFNRGNGEEDIFFENRIEVTAELPHNIRMLSKVCSAAVNGIEAYPMEVEVNAGWGDTKIIIEVNVNPTLVISGT
ncbi:MAG TPA: hypothetical protein VH597_07975 [Verrucomicrobiae bacterium]|nr:hypothetical protein [Verrucomicrobiae bacterium]